MKTSQAPHEKLTDSQLEETIENLLSNHLEFRYRWNSSDWQEHEFDIFIKKQDEMIFKIRRHFFPEKTLITHVTLNDLDKLLYEEYPKFSL